MFLAFFGLFTLATLVVPIPLFPGNMLHSVFSSLGIATSLFTQLLNALANGILYGLIVWIVFILASREIERHEAMVNLRNSMHAPSTVESVNCPVHFGCLSKLSPGSSIPEECYMCPRIEQCIRG